MNKCRKCCNPSPHDILNEFRREIEEVLNLKIRTDIPGYDHWEYADMQVDAVECWIKILTRHYLDIIQEYRFNSLAKIQKPEGYE